MKKRILLASIISSFLVGGLMFVYADWTAPTWTPPPPLTPPNCKAGAAGCDAPINVSGAGQVKQGGLTVGATGPLGVGFVVLNGKVGIGTPAPSGLFHVKSKSLVAASSATGGTITTSGGYTIHTFTTSGTFTPSSAMNVEVLVVAGGGGGGDCSAGGGGAGGFRTATGFAVTAQPHTVTIGAGGAGATVQTVRGSPGQDSSFSTITSTGGGGGGSCNIEQVGGSGGSGGGSGNDAGARAGGVGTTGQGNNGGTVPLSTGDPWPGSGGGGASATGANAVSGTVGANGGNGSVSSISGSSVTYAGGGGGGIRTGGTASVGGAGGGGAGGAGTSGAAGSANTGGGGGGGGDPGDADVGGSGGSGIVIIRYLTGGVEVAVDSLVVDSTTGNVGIGTANPFAGRLHVNKAATGLGGEIWITNTVGTVTTGDSVRLALSPESNTDATPNAAIYGIIENPINSVGAIGFNTWNGSSFGERVRITGAGNVGIGRLTPLTKLHIAGTGGSQEISLEALDAPGRRWSWQVDPTGTMQIIDRTGAVNRMTIDTSGNVGIGTTNPTAGRLQVEGGDIALGTDGTDRRILLYSNVNGADAILIRRSDNTNSAAIATSDFGKALIFKAGGTESVRFTGAGNVGIGTTAPGAKLHVRNQALFGLNDTAQVNQGGIYVASGNGAGGARQYWIGSGHPSSFGNANFYIDDAQTIGTDGFNLLTILGAFNGALSGNVGIGTTNPAHKLDVAGGIHATADVCTDLAGGKCLSTAAGGGITGNGSPNILAKWTGNTSLGNSSLFDNGTNVGIGTAAPDGKLHVAGGPLTVYPKPGQADVTSAVFSNNADATIRFHHVGGLTRIHTDGGQGISLATNGENDRLFINSAGNVGIGNTGPSAKLHIGNNTIFNNTGLMRFSACNVNCTGNRTWEIGTSNDQGGGNQFAFRIEDIGNPGVATFRIIYDSGNVGIGTPVPGEKLEVNGNIKATKVFNPVYAP